MPLSIRSRLLCGATLALGLGLALPAAAADLALIIDNAGSDRDQDIELLGDVLNARGYEVYDREDASRGDIAAVLSEIAARVPGADRLIIVFAGDTRTRGAHNWLMPDGYDGQGWVEAAMQGVSLDVLFEMASLLPGRAAVIVGTTGGEAAGGTEGLAVSAGVGLPEVPQGVLFVAGRIPQALAVVRNGLLGQGTSVADALEILPRGVRASGLVSPDARFVTGPAPRGATRAPSPAPTQPVVARANGPEAAEDALNLGVTERRRIQQQLTVLGFSTRGIDGIFGPGTRGSIGEWQGSQNLPATGYLDRAQLSRLATRAEARSAELAAEAERAKRSEEAADGEFWRTTGASGSAADLRSYLQRYPDGVYAAQAREQLGQLEAATRSNAAAEDRAAWERAEGANTVQSYQNYLATFPRGAFSGQAEARVTALSAQPDRERADRASAGAEEELGLGQGSKALIEGQLASLGYSVGEADGSFDADTRRGLREFQTRQGLEVTGYVNQETVQALIVASLGLN